MPRLAWPDLRNARDLGGIPTAGGGLIRERALVRTDNHGRLDADGIAAMRSYGVSRVVRRRGNRPAAVLTATGDLLDHLAGQHHHIRLKPGGPGSSPGISRPSTAYRRGVVEISDEDPNGADGEYVEGWYNTRCRHSSLGYLSPAAFEATSHKPLLVGKVA